MANDGQQWAAQLSDTLAKVLGAGEWQRLVSPLREHEQLKQAVVTVFGAYDSGKSTLLKRLLVDDGKPVPAWLTISARRETFESQAIDLSWARLRDTPGLAGGNAEHERTAVESLMLSDAVLLVMPPQLLTGEREAIEALLLGKRFTSVGQLALPKEAIFVAVARMDEAGTDPAENLAGYQALCARKRTELAEQFGRAGVTVDDSRLSFVAADPYQQVGNREGIVATAYDEFRAWDGVRELRESLARVSADLPRLRPLAAARYLASLGSAALGELVRRRGEVDAALSECRNGRERLALLHSQHDALLKAARADLDGVVNEQLRSSTMAGLASAAEVAQVLEPRMTKAFETWEARHVAALAKLAREADVELKARASRPGARHLHGVFKEAVSDKEGPAQKQKGPPIGKLGGALKDALRAWHEAKLGMTLRVARNELEKLANHPTFEAYRESAKGKSAFKTADNAAQAQKVVGLHQALEILGPVVIELGSLLLEEKAKQDAVKARAARREQLQSQLKDVATGIADDFWKGLEARGAELTTWLEAQDGPLASTLKVLEGELKETGLVIASLEGQLAEAPGSFGR